MRECVIEREREREKESVNIKATGIHQLYKIVTDHPFPYYFPCVDLLV